MAPRRVAVIGAGISGLASAYYLQRNSQDTEILIFESESTCGGKLVTSSFAGLAVDEGADSFLARVHWAFDLCKELGLESKLVSPSARRASLWLDEKLQSIPSPNVLGVPLNIDSIPDGLLSPEALSRLSGEGFPDHVLPTGDLSVGQVIRACVGSEVLERLVDPLLGGVNAGKADEMSCALMAPQLLEAAHHPDGMLNHLRNVAKNVDPNAPVFHAHPEGMSRIITALTESLKSSLRTSTQVQNISFSEKKWRIDTENGFELVDGILLSTPAHVSSNLLRNSFPSLAKEFASIKHASVVLITFGYSRTDFEADASQSGFLVPRESGLLMTACSFSGSKWPHLKHPDLEILRVSTGRIDDTKHLSMTDEELLSELQSDLLVTLGIESAPVDVRVSRWPDSLTQFPVGHVDFVADLQNKLSHSAPGLISAGTFQYGVGVPACVRSGKEGADQMTTFLDG